MEEYYKTFLIGEVSKMFDISPGSIRHYEKIGLINSKKDNSNYRQYDLTLIEQISSILFFRSLDLSLFDILEIKESIVDDTGKVIDIIKNQIEITERRLAYLERLSRKIKNYLTEFERIKACRNKFIVKNSPELLFTNLSNSLNSKEMAKNLYKLMNNSLSFPKTSFFIDKDKILSEKYSLDTYMKFGVCIELAKDSCNEELSDYEIILPSKKCLYSVFFGMNYYGIGEKYEEMLEWINDNNYRLTDNPFEINNLCLDNKFLMEIYMPIESKN